MEEVGKRFTLDVIGLFACGYDLKTLRYGQTSYQQCHRSPMCPACVAQSSSQPLVCRLLLSMVRTATTRARSTSWRRSST